MDFICRNLDLCGIIWLNVSRKFLSFHKFFFADNDDCLPCEFKKEIEHHSHTHTPVATTLATTTHYHSLPPTGYTACGVSGGTAHLHYNDISSYADNHSHNITISLAAGNIGALPNWQLHTHAKTGTSDNAGNNHSHTPPAYVIDDGCTKYVAPNRCTTNPHSHTNLGSITASTNSHSHTVTGNSGNGVGTCVNHTHLLSGNSSFGDGHVHATSGNTGSSVCYFGGNHYHTAFGGANTDGGYHNHTYSVTSGASSADPLCTPAAVGGILAQVI